MSILGADKYSVFCRTISTTIALFICALTSTDARACDCLWEGSFSEVVSAADLVVLGSPNAPKGNAFDVEIDVTLLGPEWIETPRVWLKTGAYCRPEVSEFSSDERYIFALKKITEVPNDGFNPSTPNVSFGRVGDYELSSCGGYWLSVKGLRASGNLVPGMPRYAQNPKMSPVHVGHVIAFLKGRASLESLTEAARLNPELEALKKDSRSFIRGFGDDLGDDLGDDNDEP